MAGASLPEVQNLLGHARPETTMRYRALSLEHKRQALERLLSKWRRHIVPSEPHKRDDETSKPRRTARTTDVSRTLAAAPIQTTEAPKPSRDATRG